MNDIAFFGVISLILLRMMGLGITINLFLDLRRSRFKIIMLGWAIWIMAGVFPLVSENVENTLLSESLLVANGIAAALGAFLIFLGILFYFTDVPGKLSLVACVLIVIVPVFLFLIMDWTMAVNFSSVVLYLALAAAYVIAAAKRKILGEMIGKGIIWFHVTMLFSAFWVLFVLFLRFSSSEYFYGFYQSTDNLAVIVNYFLAIGITTAVLVLFIHLEYSISQVEKYQLKDKYSHNLGNILQALTSAASLLELRTSRSQEDLANLELVQQKCVEASSLVKEIRKL
ncbi:MAG: hypothetical protein ACE5OZ_18490 [Candidatus Heimdallarchaeota archaeon]